MAALGSPAIHTYAIVAASAAGQFGTTVLLARFAGPAVVGDFALAITTASLLTGLALLGTDRTMMREVGGDLRLGHQARARAVIGRLAMLALVTSVAIAALYLLLLHGPVGTWLGGDRQAMMLSAGIVVVATMLRQGRAVLRALGRPVLSQITQETTPLLKLVSFGLLILLGVALSPGLLVAVALALFAGGACWVWALVRSQTKSWPSSPTEIPRSLLWGGLPIMTTLFLQSFSQWFVLAQLSASGDSAEVGIFRVTAQLAGVIATITQTTEVYVAPRMAGDFRAGRHDLAWRRHRRGTIAMLALSAPLIAVSVLAPQTVLRLLFGPEFVAGAAALAIVALGQLANTMRGPLGALLSMSSNERIQLWLTLASVALTVGLGLWLIPVMGVTGAAIAYSGQFLLRSILGYVIARRVLGGA